jgi:hypothetical protein
MECSQFFSKLIDLNARQLIDLMNQIYGACYCAEMLDVKEIFIIFSGQCCWYIVWCIRMWIYEFHYEAVLTKIKVEAWKMPDKIRKILFHQFFLELWHICRFCSITRLNDVATFWEYSANSVFVDLFTIFAKLWFSILALLHF